jgi:hypothetical protein
VFLGLASFASWFLSTLAGGGTPLVLIPAIGCLLGSNAVSPVLTIGMLLGHPQRVLLYWQHIQWRLMWWYLPGAILGGASGAYVFTRIRFEGLSILLAIVLLSSIFSYSWDEEESSWQMQDWYFLPGGFIFAFLSGLIGSTGPLLNPLYLKYGLAKEEIIATKSAHMLVVHIAKTIAYIGFGALNLPYLGYGLLLGIAALPGNWLGQIVLKQVSETLFRRLVVGFVALSGLLILWEQKDVFVVWEEKVYSFLSILST